MNASSEPKQRHVNMCLETRHVSPVSITSSCFVVAAAIAAFLLKWLLCISEVCDMK